MSDNYATWLSPSLLLAAGSFDAALLDSRATLTHRDETFAVDVRSMECRSGRALTLGAGQVSDTVRAAAELSLEGTRLKVTDLQAVLENGLSGLDPSASATVVEFVSSAPSEHGLGGRDLGLSKRLHALRERLRPALPALEISPERPQGAHPDVFVAVDDNCFYVAGWMRDAEAEISRLTAVSPEGERIELLERLFRHPRPDLESVYADGPYANQAQAEGFLGHFETKRPSYLPHGWVFEMANVAGSAVEMRALPPVHDLTEARYTILGSVPQGVLPNQELMANHVFPAMNRLTERARALVGTKDVIDYGSPVDSPQVSIVVPLYRRIDLLEHQLAQFVHDPEIRSTELIYVLDTPELDKALAEQARQLFQLYRVPFRVVTMQYHAGFGAATNAGASAARGRLLVLLNSDVLPDKPGWVGKMQRFYDSKDEIGALGAKLLYEDDSLQHAGMYFEVWDVGPSAGEWATFHYFKGLNRDLPAANVARPVPAVTAACLMIEKDLYESVGGLPDTYVRGDYEDSDLCLGLFEAGRENWYLPEAELYHLEGQSYAEADRGAAAVYNRWLHNQRWRQSIESVMSRYPSSSHIE